MSKKRTPLKGSILFDCADLHCRYMYKYTSADSLLFCRQVLSALLASAAVALPIEDTEDVAAAKAQFNAAFEKAAAGGLAAVQAAQIPETYLEDAADVAEAKAAFKAAFDDAAAGGLAAKQAPAPVHVVPAAAPLAAPAAPVSYVMPGYTMPYAYAGMPYGYAGLPYGYAGLGYAGLGYPYTTLVQVAQKA